jgi:hypothetical protein
VNSLSRHSPEPPALEIKPHRVTRSRRLPWRHREQAVVMAPVRYHTQCGCRVAVSSFPGDLDVSGEPIFIGQARAGTEKYTS